MNNTPTTIISQNDMTQQKSMARMAQKESSNTSMNIDTLMNTDTQHTFSRKRRAIQFEDESGAQKMRAMKIYQPLAEQEYLDADSFYDAKSSIKASLHNSKIDQARLRTGKRDTYSTFIFKEVMKLVPKVIEEVVSAYELPHYREVFDVVTQTEFGDACGKAYSFVKTRALESAMAEELADVRHNQEYERKSALEMIRPSREHSLALAAARARTVPPKRRLVRVKTEVSLEPGPDVIILDSQPQAPAKPKAAQIAIEDAPPKAATADTPVAMQVVDAAPPKETASVVKTTPSATGPPNSTKEIRVEFDNIDLNREVESDSDPDDAMSLSSASSSGGIYVDRGRGFLRRSS
jgi:hypothetical protein